MLTLISKDVPDLEGDRVARLSTVITELGLPKLKYYKFLSAIPAILCTILVFGKILPLRYIWVTPVSLLSIFTIFHLIGDLSPKKRRSKFFLYFFTYSQLGMALIYMLIPAEITLSMAIVYITVVILTLIWIFTVGYLYPRAGEGVAVPGIQSGG